MKANTRLGTYLGPHRTAAGASALAALTGIALLGHELAGTLGMIAAPLAASPWVTISLVAGVNYANGLLDASEG